MEQKEESAKTSESMDETKCVKDDTIGKHDLPKISRIITPTISYFQAAQQTSDADAKNQPQKNVTNRILTNQDFLEEKLANCKKFISNIKYLKDTELQKSFLKITPREILEWVIWIRDEKKTIDTGVTELFTLHHLSAHKLEKDEFERIKAYFNCFQTIATHNY